MSLTNAPLSTTARVSSAPPPRVPLQVAVPPVERGNYGGVRGELPTVRIRNGGLIRMWFRGPRMPMSAVAVCLSVAAAMGILAGMMLRMTTQMAFDARATSVPRAVAGR